MSRAPPRTAPDPVARPLAFTDYVDVLYAQRGTIAVATLAAALVALAYLFLAAPIYRSDVLVQVEDQARTTVPGLDEISAVLTDRNVADTEMTILRSRFLLGSIVDQLDLTVEIRPRTLPVIGAALARRHEGPGVASPRFGLGSYAWGGEVLRVSRLRVPEAVLGEWLTLVARDGGAFEVIGAHGGRVASGRVGERAALTGGGELVVQELRARPGTRFLVRQRYRDDVIRDLQGTIRVEEEGKKTGMIGISLRGSDPGRVFAIMDAMARTYLRQNIERRSAEAQKTLEFVQGQLPGLRRHLVEAEAALQQYQQKKRSVDVGAETRSMLDRSVEIEKAIAELDLERADLEQRFGESHPARLALRQKEERLRAERSALMGKMRDLPEQELESARLARDVKVTSELYFTLQNKSQELEVLKSGTIGNIRVIDQASLPHDPVGPRKALTLALAIVLGVAGGVAAAFARNALARGVADPEAIEAATGLPVYAMIPHSDRQGGRTQPRRRGSSILAEADPDDIAVESVRSLRTGLHFALTEAPNNIVAIGGPAPGVGKSFVAVNFAYVQAAAGSRVLLVDGDLRRGRLHRYFGLERGPGLTQVVAGDVPLAGAAVPTRQPNLHVLATGTLPAHPSEVVESPRFRKALESAAQAYDLVVIDTPPILAVTDGALVGALAGVNLVVLRWREHSLREIRETLNRMQLAGANVNGLVINDVALGLGRYGKNLGYAYEYTYRPMGSAER